jgi:amino acid transporter
MQTAPAKPDTVPTPRPVARRRAVQPPRGGYLFKRAVLGPALPTEGLRHERLGKPTALAVFASDNLSSVAYATEEILKVGVPIVGLAAFTLLMPVTYAILAVLAILLFSYRQTIKAYPSAGGAYIVTKDNFGLLTAQIAGVALLTDYVLTVAVSASAGIAAITSAFPSTFPYRVPMAIACIWFLAWGNLRGVRESGRMFAIPTYFFIAMMFILLGTGLVRAFTGGLEPVAIPNDAVVGSGAVGLFLVLHAFASGGAAVTGVEAISNGVPAFKPPEWINARTTLMWMGSTLGVMFLGLSFLAMKLRVVPTEHTTVISEVGRAVFGGGFGYVLYLMLQIATTLILILAANTSFADFPRLANFHAGDHFMPKQLTKRGHRLVFSSGIVGLAIAATGLVIAFGADTHKLIPLYAIGVFTSFTLSQGGMAKRHLSLREPGWRRGLLINGVGAITTGIVTIVIAYTKFHDGAWAVIVFVPVMVWLLVRMNHRYEREAAELDRDVATFDVSTPPRPSVVVLVDDVDRETRHALQYAKTVHGTTVEALHVEDDVRRTRLLEDRWRALGSGVALRVVPGGRDRGDAIAGYVAALPADRDVNVIVPAAAVGGRFERLRAARAGTRLMRVLLPFERARITIVRDHAGHAVDDLDGQTLLPRPSHLVYVLVDRIDRASLRAIRFARSLGATEVRAVHAGADPDGVEPLTQRWMALGLPIDLDVIECWDRNIPRALEQHIVADADPRAEVTVVLPRRDFALLRQRILHDRTSRAISKALGRYPHVDLAIVPYYFGRHPLPPETTPTPSDALVTAAKQ